MDPEQCRRFVILSSITMAPVQCLHAVDGPPASFLVIDPRLVLPDYRCILSMPDTERLGVANDLPLLWLAIVTVQDNEGITASATDDATAQVIDVLPSVTLLKTATPASSAYCFGPTGTVCWITLQ